MRSPEEHCDLTNDRMGPPDGEDAFEHVDGAHESQQPSKVAILQAAKAIVRQAQEEARTKPLPPPVYLSDIDSSPVYLNGLPGLYGAAHILGDVAIADEDGEALQAAGPISAGLYQKFLATSQPPQVVRQDTVDSYNAMREDAKAPYRNVLEARLSALEDAFAAHVADGHGGRPGVLHGRGAQLAESLALHLAETMLGVDQAARAADEGGMRIPLRLPPWDRSTEAWQDGNRIFCSVRTLGPDGRVRVTTTETTAEKAVDDVVGYVVRSNVDPFAVLPVLPALAQVLGAGGLLPTLAEAVPLLRTHPRAARGEFIGLLKFDSDPALTATMALLQRCQRGDRAACGEVARLRTRGGRDLVTRAQDALLGAQSSKAQQLASARLAGVL